MVFFGKTFLYSNAPDTLASFLSFVFDTESSRSDQGSILLEIGGSSFLIVECTKKRMGKEPFFEMEINSLESLHQLQQKVEFFYYKNACKAKVKSKIESDSLRFVDPDGRIWSVVVSFSKYLADENTQDVRFC